MRYTFIGSCYVILKKIYIYVRYYRSISLLQKPLSCVFAFVLNDHIKERNDICCVCTICSEVGRVYKRVLFIKYSILCPN